MSLTHEKIKQYIKDKDLAKFYFFTDGCGGYPRDEMEAIEKDFEENHEDWRSKNGRNKLDILLMCETEDNKTIQLIQKKFNEISRKHFGEIDNTELIFEVDPSNMGKYMIDNFENFKFDQNA